MIKDNTMNYDKFGHCTKCHKNMFITEIIGGEPVERFTGQYAEQEYVLSDGTKMRVAICKECKADLTDDDSEYIMECVIRGWDVATNDLVKNKKRPTWTKEKKKAYMKKYSKLKIVRSANEKKKDKSERVGQ